MTVMQGTKVLVSLLSQFTCQESDPNSDANCHIWYVASLLSL